MTDPTPTPAALSAPVGPGQPNRPDDMRLLRHFLNAFIERGYFLQPMVALAAEGGWDDAVAKALRNVENNYFYGQADPDTKLETGDTLFQFLVQADASVKVLAASLSNETYLLATAMVPGGVDRIKRTISKKQVQVNGHAKRVQEVHEERITGHIRTYLPEVLNSLTRKQLNDVDMLMMALGTIRAESAAFQPMDEGRSKFNTSPVGTKGRHAFDLYDFRADLMIRNNEGLTKTYNRFHRPDEQSPDIVRLRELHGAMDRAVLNAYEWHDMQPVCEFFPEFDDAAEDEAEGSRSRQRKYRYRWPDDIHDEVLARLLLLNGERAAEETLAKGSAKKPSPTASRKPHAKKSTEPSPQTTFTL